MLQQFIPSRRYQLAGRSPSHQQSLILFLPFPLQIQNNIAQELKYRKSDEAYKLVTNYMPTIYLYKNDLNKLATR